MGDNKVKEPQAEAFATVEEGNSAFQSLVDMLGTRFQTLDEKVTASDARNESRFQALNEKVTASDARNESRFTAIDEKLAAMDEKLAAMDKRNESRFGSLEKEIAALDAKTEGKFDLVEQKFKSQDFKIEQCVTSAANKLMIMMLVIAGSIIASLLYGG